MLELGSIPWDNIGTGWKWELWVQGPIPGFTWDIGTGTVWKSEHTNSFKWLMFGKSQVTIRLM